MLTLRRFSLAVLGLLIGLSSVHAQRAFPKEVISRDEIVSFISKVPFNLALETLNEKSKRFAGKPIIFDRERKEPIHVEVKNLPWRRALERVLKANRLKYEEHADYFEIVSEEGVKLPELEFDLDSREVRIAAIFFEGNRGVLNELGVNWTVLRENRTRVEARQEVTTAAEGVPSVSVTRKLSPTLDVMALLQAFESKNVGEIIANPQITVISGREGQIQVGQKISIMTRDFAGNVIPTFFNTGIILTVTPEVISQDGIEFIHLIIQTERSSAIPGAVSPTINTTTAKTSALLRDGEQVVLAGLYSNEESVIRKGIPFLRSLPWWVFGLRYLTGYNYRSIAKKELIVLIQANIVPSVRERTAGEPETMQEMLERKRREFRRIQQGVRGAREKSLGTF